MPCRRHTARCCSTKSAPLRSPAELCAGRHLGGAPELLAAYRSGAGVPFATYGEERRDHIEQLNRPMFVNDLAASWLPTVPELHTRLRADPPARVAEIAWGAGWASIALAQAYPKVHVDGFDLDAASIERAARNATEAGVDGSASPCATPPTRCWPVATTR